MKFLAACFLFFAHLHLNGVIPEKVVICGVCKNVEEALPYTIKTFERIGNLFQDYRVIVYENNSIDKTPFLLKNWEEKNKRVFVQSEVITIDEYASYIVNVREKSEVFQNENVFFLPERISCARNKVLDILENEIYDDFPYVIWMDMDFTAPPILVGLIETFQNTDKWDAIFCYSIDPRGNYFDTFAFRDKEHPLGAELIGADFWQMKRNFKLTQKDAWYPVYSAFGGFGIYKRSSIEGCRYAAIVTEDLARVTFDILNEGKVSGHKDVLNYLNQVKELINVPEMGEATTGLPRTERYYPVRLPYPYDIIWRMNAGVSQFPAVCEHVSFHASMIAKGHGKLFINPRINFQYTDR